MQEEVDVYKHQFEEQVNLKKIAEKQLEEGKDHAFEYFLLKCHIVLFFSTGKPSSRERATLQSQERNGHQIQFRDDVPIRQPCPKHTRKT